jgi:hypothetical protein
MKEVKLKTIEQSDNVCLYSICFDGSEESEFEKFLATFKDNGKHNRDFSIILLALRVQHLQYKLYSYGNERSF